MVMSDGVVIFLAIVSIIAGVAPLIAVFVLTRPRPGDPDGEFEPEDGDAADAERERAP
ncbi:MAG TPA: hypothetical protein VFW96_28800 [Thermomicrobiales bacterium]|nr:hypothetical protein [Thermomicrobiales bacterium]